MREVNGSILSEMGGKIIASAVFIDLGITDAITDMHRLYPASSVIPIPRLNGAAPMDAAPAESAPGR